MCAADPSRLGELVAEGPHARPPLPVLTLDDVTGWQPAGGEEGAESEAA